MKLVMWLSDILVFVHTQHIFVSFHDTIKPVTIH